uniref:Cystatin domain-containing protein n=1 Tax=Odontella aurita TaxID=265563 RepID=A0A7S4IWP6_9STRA|mmetsp:Transcript_3154/g.8235  ORF Transcript_3154/g.8235 Transcript_3154/m.8235 type:complete len:151 (+) Transcript_3154:167-619(+)
MKYYEPLFSLIVLKAACWSTLLFRSEAMEEVPRQILGGYKAATPTDEHVMNAAGFVISALHSGEAPEGKYSFLDTLAVSEGQGRIEGTELMVVNARQQLVAGMNYQLTLAIVDSDSRECRGALEVTVWDHFGELEITRWGQEIECNGVMG